MAPVSIAPSGSPYTPPPAVPAIAHVNLGETPRPRRFVAGDLRGIVARTVSGARAAGRDYMGQSRAAAEAVMSVRPDLSFRDALDAVAHLREIETT